MVNDLITTSLAILSAIIIGMPIFLFLLIGYSFVCFFPFIIKKSSDWYNNQLENFQGISAISISFLVRTFVFDHTYSHLIQILMKHKETFESSIQILFNFGGHHSTYIQIFIIAFFFFTPIKNLFFYILNVFQQNKSKKKIIWFVFGLFVVFIVSWLVLNFKTLPKKYAITIIFYSGLTSLSILCFSILIAVVIAAAIIIDFFQKKMNHKFNN